MRRTAIVAAFVAAAVWSGAAFAGEKIKIPTGPAGTHPQVTTAIQHGKSPVTNANWARRAWRNGYGGYYAPYYSYRPYYGGYGFGNGGYYTRPYYGYPYYTPGWYGGYGHGGLGYGGWGGYNGFGGPLAYGRVGGWYW